MNKEVDMLMSNLRLEKEKYACFYRSFPPFILFQTETHIAFRNAKELARLREENAEFKKKAQEKEKEWVECKLELEHTLLEVL